MRIRWTPGAAADLEAIKDYLDAHLPHLSQPTVRKLYEGIRGLKRMPRRGRFGRVTGTRELVIPPLPYVVVDSVREEALEILLIWHGAQDWRSQ